MVAMGRNRLGWAIGPSLDRISMCSVICFNTCHKNITVTKKIPAYITFFLYHLTTIYIMQNSYILFLTGSKLLCVSLVIKEKLHYFDMQIDETSHRVRLISKD